MQLQSPPRLHWDLVMPRGVTYDEKKGKIAIDTFNGSTDVFVPREDFADVLAFIERRIPKKRTKRKKEVTA